MEQNKKDKPLSKIDSKKLLIIVAPILVLFFVYFMFFFKKDNATPVNGYENNNVALVVPEIKDTHTVAPSKTSIYEQENLNKKKHEENQSQSNLSEKDFFNMNVPAAENNSSDKQVSDKQFFDASKQPENKLSEKKNTGNSGNNSNNNGGNSNNNKQSNINSYSQNTQKKTTNDYLQDNYYPSNSYAEKKESKKKVEEVKEQPEKKEEPKQEVDPFGTIKLKDNKKSTSGGSSSKDEKKSSNTSDFIRAEVYSDQTIEDKGSIVLRLVKSVSYNNKKIPANSLFYGKVSYAGNRALVNLHLCKTSTENIPVNMELYDVDYISGIYSKTQLDKAIDKSTEDAPDNTTTTTKSQLIQKTFKTISKAVASHKSSTIQIEDGYVVYLKFILK